MRKVLAVMLAVCMMMCVISSAGFARELYDYEPIEEFPADGVCTGDNVRFRSGPGTNYKVLGKLNEDDNVVVRGSKTVKGDLWYKIDDPRRGKRGTVWVASWYIEAIDFDDN